MSTNLTPQIYVACLASYNNGFLHGQWIDATQSEEEIHAEIQQMLAKSATPNAEEWAIHDYEDFGSYPLSEYESISSVCEIAAFIEEHGELGIEVASYMGDLKGAQEALENSYHGEYDNELDFATNLFDECYGNDIPENLKYYIDYDAFCRDIFISDYYSIEVAGKYHVFSNY